MKDQQEMASGSSEPRTPTVPTHVNWAEERGFGQQTSPAPSVKQYDLKLTEPPASSGK